MKQHKAESVATAGRVMGVSPEIAGKVYDELMPDFNSTGRFNPNALEALSKSYVEMGILPRQPDMSKLVTQQFLPAMTPKDK
jgi:hypothetical protein